MTTRLRSAIDGFYQFVSQPLYLWSRPVLVLLVVPLAFSVLQPLWHIRMEAPQYPEGLTIDVYSYKLVGGHDGSDIHEINILNHYIGMKKLDRGALAELDWLPFGFGALGLLLLRVAALGNVRSLLDFAVMTGYFGGFSMARFVTKMYSFGHDLAHDAPVKVKPFTPVLWGTKEIANFTTHGYPGTGTWLVAGFTAGVFLITLIHLVEGRRRARRAAVTEV